MTRKISVSKLLRARSVNFLVGRANKFEAFRDLDCRVNLDNVAISRFYLAVAENTSFFTVQVKQQALSDSEKGSN